MNKCKGSKGTWYSYSAIATFCNECGRSEYYCEAIMPDWRKVMRARNKDKINE